MSREAGPGRQVVYLIRHILSMARPRTQDHWIEAALAAPAARAYVSPLRLDGTPSSSGE